MPTIGWHGEQNTGASVGADSIAAGCSTLAASQFALAFGDPLGDATELVVGAPDEGVDAQAATIPAAANPASKRRGCVCRIRRHLRNGRTLPMRMPDLGPSALVRQGPRQEVFDALL